MEIKCSECHKNLMEPVDIKWQSWMRLVHFLEIQNLQGEITNELFEQLYDDLQWFKPVDSHEVEEGE